MEVIREGSTKEVNQNVRYQIVFTIEAVIISVFVF